MIKALAAMWLWLLLLLAFSKADASVPAALNSSPRRLLARAVATTAGPRAVAGKLASRLIDPDALELINPSKNDDPKKPTYEGDPLASG
jgi:hypothetical protein